MPSKRTDAGKPAEPVGPAGDGAVDNLVGKVITARQTLPPRLGRDQEGAFDSGRIHARNHLIESATKRQLWTGLDLADPDRDETVAAALVVVQGRELEAADVQAYARAACTLQEPGTNLLCRCATA